MTAEQQLQKQDDAEEASSSTQRETRRAMPPGRIWKFKQQNGEGQMKQREPSNELTTPKSDERTLGAKGIIFSLKSNAITIDSQRSPLSLPHLIIRMENRFLTHFYSRHYKNGTG
jgi:hypothetical protein